MLTLTIKFSYQEPHKLKDNLSYITKIFSFNNKDELNGFLIGLNFAIDKIYQNFEIVEEN